MDYLDVIAHTPLYAYHATLTVVGFITSLPWPSGQMVFTSTSLLVILYIPRLLIHLLLPEEKVAYIIQRKLVRKRTSKLKPTADDHKAGASVVIDSMLHHF